MTQHPPPPSRQTWRTRLGAASAARARTYLSRSVGWRLLGPAVFVVAGLLFITSMVSSGGTDLRAGRYTDLQGLATAEARDLAALNARSAALSAEVQQLSESLALPGDDRARASVERLSVPAGLAPVTGPGVTVTLDDAPESALDAAGSNVSDLIVHQQDIQAVANALWSGGAEAMTLQGQRVIATTGIKCVGNTVVLHGVPYSPPYRITAVGPVSPMMSALASSPYIGLYLSLVPQGLGWDVREETSVRLPGYDGSTDLDYARPASDPAAIPAAG
ncbi:MAG: DUF881 domain-containing protein [Nocardioidaceae bacterium]